MKKKKTQPQEKQSFEQPHLENNRNEDGRGSNEFPQRPVPENKGHFFENNGYHSNHHAINHQI
jgi:hypothetical protein